MIYYAFLPNPTAPDAATLRACRRSPRVRAAWLAAFVWARVRQNGFITSTGVRAQFDETYGLEIKPQALRNKLALMVAEGRLAKDGRGFYRLAGPPSYRTTLQHQGDLDALALFDALCRWEGAWGDIDRLHRRSGVGRRKMFRPLRRLVSDGMALAAIVNGRRAWKATKAALAAVGLKSDEDIFS